MVALVPVFVVVAMAAFQAAMWSHARAQARAVARDTAASVARSGVPVDLATSTARATLADLTLTDGAVRIDVDDQFVTVVVTGRAPGMVRGTWSGLAVEASLPVERWRP